MTPSKKSRAMDRLFQAVFGFDRRESIKAGICVPKSIGCGGPATVFRDARSTREYAISGLCQQCQDNIFGGEA